jgi:hypothetical protein
MIGDSSGRHGNPLTSGESSTTFNVDPRSWGDLVLHNAIALQTEGDTMAPSKASLDALAGKASKLNAATDELSEIFEQLEAKLEASKVGVSVWLRRLLDAEAGEPNDRDRGIDEGWTVGYGKVGGQWRLAARRERWPFAMEAWPTAGGDVTRRRNYDGDPIVTDSAVPLIHAPRSVRAVAAGLLDELIEKLSAQVDHYLENIEKAKATASIEATEGGSVPAAKVDSIPFRSPKRRI